MAFFNWLKGLIAKPQPAQAQPAKTEHVPEVLHFIPLTDLERKYVAAKVHLENLSTLKAKAGKITASRAQYEKVEKATGVPWWVVACIHCEESGLNFSTHLHNGDPLTARTYHVPAGRPKAGKPPFAWYDSAIDALGGNGSHKSVTWTLGYALDWMEKYNGIGYRNRGIASPYIWAMTDQYVKGHYVADGVFEANAVSKNTGAAALMKTLGLFA